MGFAQRWRVKGRRFLAPLSVRLVALCSATEHMQSAIRGTRSRRGGEIRLRSASCFTTGNACTARLLWRHTKPSAPQHLPFFHHPSPSERQRVPKPSGNRPNHPPQENPQLSKDINQTSSSKLPASQPEEIINRSIHEQGTFTRKVLGCGFRNPGPR